RAAPALPLAAAALRGASPPRGRAGLPCPPLAGGPGGAGCGRTPPFSKLEPEARERALAAWETSRLPPRRQLLASLKLLALMHFYERPDVWPAIGYDDGHLRRKLFAGPNAAHHAARLGVVS